MAKYESEKFFAVEIAKIRPGEPVPFVVHLYLPINGHIIAVYDRGDTPDEAFLKKVGDGGFRELHVGVEDEKLWEQYLKGPETTPVEEPKVEEPKEEEKPPEPPKEEPVPVVEEEKAEEMMAGLLSEKVEDQQKAKEEVKQLVENVLEEVPEEIKEELKDLLEKPNTEHANSVALYAVLFGIALGHNDKNILRDLTIAGLLHDVGLSQVMPSVVAIPVSKRNEMQSNHFKHHVNRGLELLAEMNFVPNDRVLQIVGEHHEKFDGTGYPDAKEGFKIEELAQALGFSDLIDSYMRGWQDGNKYTLSKTLEIIADIEHETTFPHYFNPDLFSRILNWIKEGSGKDYMQTATNIMEEAQKEVMQGQKK